MKKGSLFLVIFLFCICSAYSGNRVFNGFQLKPRHDSGRTTAGFADVLYLYGNTSKLFVDNCRFLGNQNERLNVHNYLKIAKTIKHQLEKARRVSNMHVSGNTVESSET